MRDHVIGLAAVAALLWVAYNASEQTISSWRVAGASATASHVAGSELDERKPISDAEAVVGRPHDGIRALPARRVERKTL
jgi:hypothetical protein